MLLVLDITYNNVSAANRGLHAYLRRLEIIQLTRSPNVKGSLYAEGDV